MGSEELSPLATLLGREIVSSDDAGQVRVRFRPSAELNNRYGTIQGGILRSSGESVVGFLAV